MSNITYIINSKEYGKKDFINKELLLRYLFDRFSLEAVEKVKEWKDDFDGREHCESYIDTENSFAIISLLWD